HRSTHYSPTTQASTNYEVPTKYDNVLSIMFKYLQDLKPVYLKCSREIQVGSSAKAGILLLATVSILASLFSLPVCAQQTSASTPVVVQPGAPGKPTKTLPPTTRATLPPVSPSDVKFMQG